MTFGYIYRIINIRNQKSYIGKTKSKYGIMNWSVEKRWRRHLNKALSKNPLEYNECPLFYRAIRKYGKESFIIETLVICDMKDVDTFEIKMIKLYSSNDRNWGYNIYSQWRKRKICCSSFRSS